LGGAGRVVDYCKKYCNTDSEKVLQSVLQHFFPPRIAIAIAIFLASIVINPDFNYFYKVGVCHWFKKRLV